MAAAPLIDDRASPETRALHARLHELTGQRTLFGHQDDPVAASIRAAAGTPPGVVGFDLGGIEALAGHNLDGVPFPTIIRSAREAHGAGSLVTLSWHSVNPLTHGGYGDNTAPLSAASVLPGGREHEKYLKWLGHVAMLVEQLTDASGRAIPIVFRPFHEHNGDWFWWGLGDGTKSTDTRPEEFVALWQFTVEYLRDVAALHNLIWAISPDRSRIPLDDVEAGYLRGYPGDEFVDVLGIDDYWDAGRSDDERNADQLLADHVRTIEAVARLGQERGKLVAQTETGVVGARVGHTKDPWTGFLAPVAECSDLTRRHLWHLVWRGELDAPADLAALAGHPFFAFAGDADLYKVDT